MTEFDINITKDYSEDLFKGKDFTANDQITIHHLTVGDILDIGEENYQKYTFIFTSTPSNYKFQLYDAGIRFDELSEWELFLFYTRQQLDNDISQKIITGFNFVDAKVYINKDNDELVLVDAESQAVLDRAIYAVIADYLRQMNFITKKTDRAMTESTLVALVEESRERFMRDKDKPFESAYIPMIMSAMNRAEFKYDYFTVQKLPIYVFLGSVRRVGKMVKYDHMMTGVYTGSIDAKSLKPSDMDWLSD